MCPLPHVCAESVGLCIWKPDFPRTKRKQMDVSSGEMKQWQESGLKDYRVIGFIRLRA